MDRTPETSQILFVNVQNLLDDTEINHHLSLLSTHNIKSNFFDTTGKAQASVEDFTSFVIIVLNETLVQQYLGGILTNAAWDAIKSTMLKVWQATLGKKYYIIRAHAEPEPRDVTLGIELKSEKHTIHFQFSGEMSEEMQSKYIDKAFDSFTKLCEDAKSDILPHVARFDQEWKLVDKRKEIEEKQKSTRKKKKK